MRASDGWEMRRLKTVASVRTSNVDKKSVEGETPVQLCNYTDVYYGDRIDSAEGLMQATATPDQIRRFELRAGDVLLTKDSESWTDIAVPAFVSRSLPGVLCGYHLAIVRPGSSLDGRYLYYCYLVDTVADQLRLGANGITRYGLSTDVLTDVRIPLPPLPTQRAIASFLDRKTAKIDTLIEKKERLLALLEERRTSAIDLFVVQGLDGATLRETGNPLFPRIPAAWAMAPLRRLLRQVKRPLKVVPEETYSEIGIRSWGRGIFHKDPVQGSDLGDKRVFRLRPEDFVLNIVFAWEGAVGVVSADEEGMIASHRFPTFRHDSDLVRMDYLHLLMRSSHGRALMGLHSPGAAGRNRTIRLGAFLSEEVPLPPRAEQDAILRKRASAVAVETSLSKQTSRAITLLREYRSALISAAVTGQLDIPAEDQEAA